MKNKTTKSPILSFLVLLCYIGYVVVLGFLALYAGESTITIDPFNIEIGSIHKFCQYILIMIVFVIAFVIIYCMGKEDGIKEAQKLKSDKEDNISK